MTAMAEGEQFAATSRAQAMAAASGVVLDVVDEAHGGASSAVRVRPVRSRSVALPGPRGG